MMIGGVDGRIVVRALILMPLVFAAGCAATPAETARARADASSTAADLSTALAGLTPEGTSDCISALPQTRSTKAYGPVILYTVSRGLIYRNDTSGGCEGVARGDILVTKSPSGRVCRGDIGQTIQPFSRVPTGSCSLGAFTTYRRR